LQNEYHLQGQNEIKMSSNTPIHAKAFSNSSS